MSSWLLETCDACEIEQDYSSTPECDACDNEKAGIDNVMIALCKSSVEALVVNPCDGSPVGGAVSDVTIPVAASRMAFHTKDSTTNATSTLTYSNDDRTKTLSEIITGMSLSGPQELCWMRNNIGKEFVLFIKDRCDKIRVYGIEGGLRLQEFIDNTGTVASDQKGITFTFENTLGEQFYYVDNIAFGFPDADDFMEALYNANIV